MESYKAQLVCKFFHSVKSSLLEQDMASLILNFNFLDWCGSSNLFESPCCGRRVVHVCAFTVRHVFFSLLKMLLL